MADPAGSDQISHADGIVNGNSPPPTPPSPVGSDSARASLKRDREQSQEPVAQPISTVDGVPNPREISVPKKKNRLNLDSTAEEDDSGSRSRSTSPTLQVGTPPRELRIKVRQISQGVEDLSWRNMKKNRDDTSEHASISFDIEENTEDDNKHMDVAPSTGTSANAHPSDIPPTSSQPGSDKDLLHPNDAEDVDATYRGPDSESGERDKGVKRKHAERGNSQGPPETATPCQEPVKRPRDDADADANPRETKRPSPPPEAPPKKTPQKATGFMAYASTNSPFSSVKGPNIFASASSSQPSIFSSSVTSASSTSSLLSPASAPSTTPISASVIHPASAPAFHQNSATMSAFQVPTPASASALSSSPVKFSGFGAYANNGSPFNKLNRSKSPPRKATSSSSVNAFSPYKGAGVHSFMKSPRKSLELGSPGTKSVFANESGTEAEGDEEDEEEEASFGDKLRAGRDDSEDDGEKSRLNLTEQDVVTGEEDEHTIFSVRGKLYALNGSAWKERGTGLLKVNVNEVTGKARILMRKDAVHTTLLNAPLFAGMHCTLAQEPRYLRFSVIEKAGQMTHLNLRLGNAQAAQDLLASIQKQIPES